MAKVHLFNPENDVALGYWRRSFTLSPLVRSLHADGAALPVWYASPDDYVYCPKACDFAEWSKEMSCLFGLKVNLSDSLPSGLDGAPWGWSLDAARQMSVVGAIVPDEESLLKIRELSHRRLTVAVMSRLRVMLPFELPEIPVEAKSVAEVRRQFEKWGGKMYVKEPWSSSGRGVIYLDRLSESDELRIANIIRRQGSVMCEFAVSKRRDFAMEFRSLGGRVEWVAYSLFFNGHGTSYCGNLLAPDSEIESILASEGVDLDKLNALKETLLAIFTDLVAPYYEGCFGVDMMVAEDGMIVPCVEVNLRMTMGMVAAIWRDRYLSPDSRGRYYVRLLASGQSNVNAPVIRDGRLIKGRLSLTHLTPDSKFEFVVEVD